MKESKEILVSISLDTSELQKEINEVISLLKLQPRVFEAVSNQLLSNSLRLSDYLIFTDSSATIAAGRTINIIKRVRLSRDFYFQIFASTMRASIRNGTHA